MEIWFSDVYKNFISQIKDDKEQLMKCTVVAANHPYSCQCPSCLVHWACCLSPGDWNEHEWGSFEPIILNMARELLGKPKIVKMKCSQCDVISYEWENSERPMCEEHAELFYFGEENKNE